MHSARPSKPSFFSFAAMLALAGTVALLALLAPLPAHAQDPAAPAATTTPPAAAPEAAAPTTADLEKRIADLEAYVNNGARGDADLTKSKVAGAGPGHNGWLMTSAALVLFMTLPGLALFYGGLVRGKNVLSVMAQCLGMAGMVSILWWAIGYSFAFAKGNPFLGGTTFAMFAGVDSVAERMKYSALMLFMLGWMFIVYFPLAHMVWGIDGFMNGVWNADAKIKAIDFAGGTVVHMSSGWSALVLALIVGKRKGFGHANFAPHSLVLTVIGTGMLWVGWYGFNAGSAAGADGVAANAFTTTTLAAAIAGASWAGVEWVTRGKPTVLGFCSGIVGGLVVITPGAGFVNATSSVIIGVLAGIVPFFACTKLKSKLGYDDALDTFGIHAVGGTLGAFLTGVFATSSVNANLDLNLKDIVGKTLWLEQIKAIGLTLMLAIVGTAVLAYALKATVGLRPTEDDEETGLDLSDHGERAYHPGETA
jgi:ammonium transporter, Amt family